MGDAEDTDPVETPPVGVVTDSLWIQAIIAKFKPASLAWYQMVRDARSFLAIAEANDWKERLTELKGIHGASGYFADGPNDYTIGQALSAIIFAEQILLIADTENPSFEGLASLRAGDKGIPRKIIDKIGASK